MSAATLPRPAWTSEEFGRILEDLEWIDTFAVSIGPYVRVRAEDGVLIKMPTEVFSLNPTGIELLRRVLAGESIAEVVGSLGWENQPGRLREVHHFFCDVRDLLSNRLGESRERRATQWSEFTGSFNRLPVLSEVAVTYKCNLACTFCYAGCGTQDAVPGNPGREKRRGSWKFWEKSRFYRDLHPKRDPTREEMSTSEVRRVLDEIAVTGQVPSVSFTGGEATLRRDLPDLIAHARKVGLRVNLITNGVRCSSREYAESLAGAGLTSAQVSLEGPDAEIHERLTQRPGSFDRTLEGIRNLKAAGLHVHTNTTVCEENADHLLAMVDLAKDLELPHFSMNHLIPTGTPSLGKYKRIRLSYTHLGPLILKVRDHAERVGIKFHWYSPTPFCIFNPIAHGLGNKGCAACDGLLHVSPSGEVLPCSSFAGGVGNLLEEGFEKVWSGRDALYYKKKKMAHPICRGCEHFALCQGACTLYWSGMGYGELYRANWRRIGRRLRDKVHHLFPGRFRSMDWEESKP